MFRFAAIVSLSLACTGPTSSVEIASLEWSPELDDRFESLHAAYIAADNEAYTPLLRASLRHGRRLTPSECESARQRLVARAADRPFDGLEPLWLLYQDCAANGDHAEIGAAREVTHQAMSDRLHFALDEPHPQLFQRVSHYNSRLERGVRGDSMRALVAAHLAMPAASGARATFHQVLRNPAVVGDMCSLPLRLDQFGDIAEAELLRAGACATGASNNRDICNRLFGPGGDASSLTLAQADVDRLAALCDRLGGAGQSASGIDLLDGFSTDWCESEDQGWISTADIAQLTMDCFFGDAGHPVADGGVTSANFDKHLNRIVTWELDEAVFEASLTLGTSPEDIDAFYLAVGSTPEEAHAKLMAQIAADTGNAWDIEVDGDTTILNRTDQVETDEGIVTIETEIIAGPDGSGQTQQLVTFPDGRSEHYTKITKSDQTSWEKYTSLDSDGKKVSETIITTDADGNQIVTVFDADGNVVSEQTIPADKTSPGEGQWDPQNEACQELMLLDIGPAGKRSTTFDELYERGAGPRPEVVNPVPDDPANWEQEPSCGAAGLGGTTQRSQCSSLVMCAEGSELDEQCQCVPPDGGGEPPGRGCLSFMCEDGTAPIPVGAFGCSCESGEEPATLPPQPDVTRIVDELVWNRPNGELVLTEPMVEAFLEP